MNYWDRHKHVAVLNYQF